MSEEDDKSRLEGAISLGNLETDYPETKEPEESEDNKEGEEAGMDAPEENKDPIEEVKEEVTPEEPISEEAVVEENVPAEPEAEEKKEETEETVPPAEPSVIPSSPKKKSKKGLIITLIIVAVLLIGGGVGFAVWAMIHESPETALRDALNGFWAADDVQLSGDIESSAAGADAVYTVEAIKSGKNISGSGTIKAKYNDQDIEINFSSAYVDNGSIYLKLDGLKDTLENIDLGSMLGGFVSDDGIDASTLLSSLLDSLVEKIDGTWYKVTTNDVEGYSSEFGCILENLGNALSRESMDKVADAYKDNAFLEIDEKASVTDKDGAKVYTLKVNKDKSKAFGEKTKDIDSFKSLTKCTESSNKDEDEEEFSYDGGWTKDEEDIVAPTTGEEEEFDGEIKVRITPWTHKLVGIEVSEKNDNNETTVDLKVSYDKKTVEEPGDAKSITALKDDIEKALSEVMNQFITELCKSMYGEYGDAFINACVEQSTQQISESGFDISDYLQQFLGIGSDVDEPTDCADGGVDNC